MVHRLNGREDLAFMTSQRLESFTSLLLPALYAQNLCQSYRSSLRHNLSVTVITMTARPRDCAALLCLYCVLCGVVQPQPPASRGQRPRASCTPPRPCSYHLLHLLLSRPSSHCYYCTWNIKRAPCICKSGKNT